MHLRSIAETAAVLTWSASNQADELSSDQSLAAAEYWKETNFLFQRWSRAIREIHIGESSPEQLTTLLEEILTAELLTRSTAARIFSFKRQRQIEDFTQVAEKSIEEHVKIRNRAFDLHGSISAETSKLLKSERLFRKVQRWSDYLVSYYLVASEMPLKAAFDSDLCLDFCDDRSNPESSENAMVARQLELVALVRSFPNREIGHRVDAEAHRSRCDQAIFLSGQPSTENSGLLFSRTRRRILAGEGFLLNAPLGSQTD
ncbi:hypothetical protein [Thalassoglobus polymorphus]|uniref:Uncharacterized protein n=1 Tax=Thalassoglobus polymorphus TaxID=2527994 RepID=A0A517QNQ9_9PLAN|nr:hypothetical protein [Thalassoglobus polymorphus]QDT33278.1 hypothetical protein Mal48_25310 [Thalassoglobus polymorphus]